MSDPSIFTRIVQGEIPAHKVYEDAQTLAFLDIHPAVEGHTLVVPKKQVDRLEDLPEADYEALMRSVRKVMKRVAEVYGAEYRACLKLEGFDVPHVHVHVMPCRTAADFWTRQRMEVEPDHEALAEVARKLSFS